jgi:predicted nucleic acid-binding protein
VTFLLDTNVVSELRKGPRANRELQAWFSSLEDEDIHLSVLVIGELRRGIESLRRRDPRQAVVLDRWLDRLVTGYGDRILGIDLAVAEAWGQLSALRPASLVDTLLAATAQVFGLTLVTRNVRDVAWTGVSCLNPFDRAHS